MGTRGEALRAHDDWRRAVEYNIEAGIQTCATGTVLQPDATRDLQFSQWTLIDERLFLQRSRRDTHSANQVETRARRGLDRIDVDVSDDRLFANLPRRALHYGCDCRIRGGVDLDPGGEVC